MRSKFLILKSRYKLKSRIENYYIIKKIVDFDKCNIIMP